MGGIRDRKAPDRSTWFAGREPGDETACRSGQLQIRHNYRETTWLGTGEPRHKHAWRDVCFIVLGGTLGVEVDGNRFTVERRAFRSLPVSLDHVSAEVHPTAETQMIRALSCRTKIH